MLETRECIIYEIIGRKVGSSITGIARPLFQLKEGESYRILETIPPNTKTIRECWEKEGVNKTLHQCRNIYLSVMGNE